MKKDVKTTLYLISIPLSIVSIILSILTFIIANSDEPLFKSNEKTTSTSSVTENVTENQEILEAVFSTIEPTTETATETPKLTASDVLSLPGIEILAEKENPKYNKIGKFVYCSSNETYYFLSNEDVIGEYKFSPDDYIIYQERVFFIYDGIVQIWPISAPGPHWYMESVGGVNPQWPLTQQDINTYMYEMSL